MKSPFGIHKISAKKSNDERSKKTVKKGVKMILPSGESIDIANPQQGSMISSTRDITSCTCKNVRR